MSENDWVWGIATHPSISDLENILVSCYQQITHENPKLRDKLLIVPMDQIVIQKSKTKLPEYQKASLLLFIFLCVHVSDTLAENIRVRYYTHVQTRWHFRIFQRLLAKLFQAEAFFQATSLPALVEQLVANYLARVDDTGQIWPRLKFQPPALLHRSPGQQQMPVVLSNPIIHLQDDDDEEPTTAKRKYAEE